VLRTGRIPNLPLPVPLRNRHLIDIDTIDEPSLLFLDLYIVSAHLPLPHTAIWRKCPVLESVTPLPLHAVRAVLEFIPELHRDAVLRKCEQLLAQLVIMLAAPLFGQELLDGIVALQEACSVAPDAVLSVCWSNFDGISTTLLDVFNGEGDLQRR